MRGKMAISAYILKIVRKDRFLRLQVRVKEDFNRRQLFSTNKQQYVKIKLMQNETNRWSIFFVKDEILVKFLFKGLNYHNFYIFDHN